MDRLQKAKKAIPRAAYKIRQRLHQALKIEMNTLIKVLNFGRVYLLKKTQSALSLEK